jgi:hypothetical protein
MAEAAGKSKQDEHTAATNLGETPEKQKNLYMTHSLSLSGLQELRFAVRTNCDMARLRYTRKITCEMMIL